MAVVSVDPFDFKAPFPLDLRMRRANIGERDTIPTNNRWEGMLVYVISDQTWYGLVGGVGNENWIEISADGALQSVTFSGDAPTGGSDGDIHFTDTGNSIELWSMLGGTWGMIGGWSYGGGGGALLDNSYDVTTTSSDIETDHSGLPVGSVIYSETSGFMWTKLALNKWTRSTLDIA